MSSDLPQFERDAAVLGASNSLTDIAVEMVGEDAGAALIGAALKAWEREFGNEQAFELAKIALQRIADASGAATSYN